MRVISLGSSSSGNALLIEAGPRGRTKLLVDAGFNGRVLTQRLRQAGVSPAQLTGVLLSRGRPLHIVSRNLTASKESSVMGRILDVNRRYLGR